jgi:hypothetical protein
VRTALMIATLFIFLLPVYPSALIELFNISLENAIEGWLR